MTGRELVQWMGSCIRERWSDLKLLVRIMFGRAWISTVALCMLFLLFFKNDQAQDILRGMIDPCKYLVLQQQPNRGPCQQSLHQYWWFFLATLLLAIPLGMVAYFAAVPSWRTDSPREGTQQMRERRVGQLWALIVLVASLAIPHFEFWMEWQSVGPALGRIIPYFVYNLLAAGPTLLLLQKRDRTKWVGVLGRVWPVASCLLLAWIFHNIYRGEISWAILASVIVPTVALLAVIALGPQLHSTRWPMVVLGVTLPLLVSFAVVSIRTPRTESWVMTAGSLFVVLVFLASITIILATCKWVVNHFELPVGVVLSVLLVLALHREERPGEETLKAGQQTQGVTTSAPAGPAPLPAEASPTTASASEASAASKIRLAISADGGGLRAALFTAEALSFADDITCGEFGEHVAAASGVSGGSLGIATWAVMRQEYKKLPLTNGWVPWGWCKEVRVEENQEPGGTILGQPGAAATEHSLNLDLAKLSTLQQDPFGSTPLTARVLATLTQDHLAPVLARMLTVDALPFGGAPQRGQALLQSWQNAALDVLWHGQSGNMDFRAFAMPLRDVTAGVVQKQPVLLFTATAVETGDRIVFSNSNDSGVAAEHLAPLTVPIGVAALNSARFPIISPSGSQQVGERSLHLVDGGFFDNSGAATLRDWLMHVTDPKSVVLARLDGNEPDEDPRAAAAMCRQFYQRLRGRTNIPIYDPFHVKPKDDSVRWSGLEAYEHARGAHAEDAVRKLDLEESSATPQSPAPDSALRLRYFANFDGQCLQNDPTTNNKTSDKPEDIWKLKCVQVNIAVCGAAATSPRAPLGWYLSPSSAGGISAAAEIAAIELVARVQPHQRPTPDIAAQTRTGK